MADEWETVKTAVEIAEAVARRLEEMAKTQEYRSTGGFRDFVPAGSFVVAGMNWPPDPETPAPASTAVELHRQPDGSYAAGKPPGTSLTVQQNRTTGN